MREYFDKHGKQIFAGMMIKDDGGNIDKVFPCSVDGSDDPEDADLGIDAVNWDSPAAREPMFYPLRNFDLNEYEIHNPEPYKITVALPLVL